MHLTRATRKSDPEHSIQGKKWWGDKLCVPCGHFADKKAEDALHEQIGPEIAANLPVPWRMAKGAGSSTDNPYNTGGNDWKGGEAGKGGSGGT